METTVILSIRLTMAINSGENWIVGYELEQL